ncbi:nucleoprotein TPR-like [Saccostrea cucullata]|uniref:nucleoprotein TPR-like n=1 Tax=Saccostrea cuccullata TaxID=36930 RepID=UPI002ED48A7C
MKMNPENERKLWRNWMFLKQELPVLEITDKMIEAGIYTEENKKDINNVKPNTKLMRAERFLNILLETGDKGYETFCHFLRQESSGRFEEINEKMEIAVHKEPVTEDPAAAGGSCDQNHTEISANLLADRQNTMNSRQSSSISRASTNVSFAADPVQAAASVQAAAAVMANVGVNESGVDLKLLETELVRIAPTIAELFQKIVQTTKQTNPSWDELQRVKADNERLRKSNRALIEKLNTFQKQIIQLQLENKKLRDKGVCETETKGELDRKAEELEKLKQKLEQQKQELEEKDQELNEQLQKIKDIEDENERQKVQILNLQVLHDEGVSERSRQQIQITELREEKEKQNNKIAHLEEMQKKDEDRLERLEARLRLLEQLAPASTRGTSYGAPRRRNARVVSPPRAMPWMSGVVNRSHHANVKFTPPPPRGGVGGKTQEKGWSF